MMDNRLLEASENGDSIIVRKLLKAKVVDPNAEDELRMSALAKACKAGHFDVAKLLLEAGADVAAINANLISPLHFAAQNDDEEMVKLLIINGAPFDAKNKDGLSPIDFTKYDSETRDIIKGAQGGIIPEMEEINEVPFIPDFAIEGGQKKKPRKKSGKKKGKKGKKGGKKKGKKKKK